MLIHIDKHGNNWISTLDNICSMSSDILMYAPWNAMYRRLHARAELSAPNASHASMTQHVLGFDMCRL